MLILLSSFLVYYILIKDSKWYWVLKLFAGLSYLTIEVMLSWAMLGHASIVLSYITFMKDEIVLKNKTSTVSTIWLISKNILLKLELISWVSSANYPSCLEWSFLSIFSKLIRLGAVSYYSHKRLSHLRLRFFEKQATNSKE